MNKQRGIVLNVAVLIASGTMIVVRTWFLDNIWNASQAMHPGFAWKEDPHAPGLRG